MDLRAWEAAMLETGAWRIDIAFVTDPNGKKLYAGKAVINFVQVLVEGESMTGACLGLLELCRAHASKPRPRQKPQLKVVK